MNLQKADGAWHPAKLGTDCAHNLWREGLQVKPKPVRDAISAAQSPLSQERQCLSSQLLSPACPWLPVVSLRLGAAAVNFSVEVMQWLRKRRQ